MRRTLILSLLLAGGLPLPLAAQYFGQNKVQYRAFEFKTIQTEHFDIYYYPEERAGALDAARMAERAYARLSRILHHQFRARKPLILYASQSDFQQTNVTEVGGEAVGGVTEFFKHRAVLPFTGSYAEFEHVLQHEMVHQFQFDIYSRGHPGAGVQTLVNVNPPLWFIEGMAEYLSRGPIDPETAMWLRDAALEGHLPSIEEMSVNPNIFPYRYGHALWAFIGERWGDEVIGEILQASASSGLEASFKRALGRSLEDLSNDWRDAIQTTFLPQLSDHYRARRIAQPLLTERRSRGRIFLAPALTPDGHDIAFFGDEGGFFVDLWLADAESGRVKRRLVKSTLNNNYESLRFINSAGSFSPDGKYFAIAAKRKERDDLVILDVKRDREERRITVKLSGLQTPRWSPDGQQLVFTGFDGGLSDLFIINRDGTGLRRLTNDKYADLHPSWSPDGKTIAFVTDRGPETDFDLLRTGNLRIALYHLDTGTIELLGHMETGKNIDPAWAPDGRSLAFVSDRTGISNVFLYDLADGELYQLTNFYTGVQGITPLSPVLSWAAQADRLAFIYYEDGQFSVYSIENPRSLRRTPYRGPAVPPVVMLLDGRDTMAPAPAVAAPVPVTVPKDGSTAPPGIHSSAAPQNTRPGEVASIYRATTGFRPSATPQAAESASTTAPLTVRALLDSVNLALPDTSEFTFHPYRVRFTADYIARPTIGYQRDNFGRGFFGGTAVSLSDILGNHTIVLSGAVNGRISEAQFLGVYVNQAHRMNWASGFSQEPLYFYGGSNWEKQDVGLADSADVFVSRIRRFVIRDGFFESAYPLSRFNRIEVGMHAVNISDASLQLETAFDGPTGAFLGQRYRTIDGPSISFIQPSIAHVHDNSLFGWVGPFAGSRSRLQISPAFGNWRFTAGLADYRRYIFFRPFTLAFRGFMFGRFGRDADRFPIFLGSTELIRGYTAGSFRNNECIANPGAASPTGCAELDQLIGSKIGVGNVELRFPLTRSLVLGFLPVGFPPIEGAIFFDAGIAWNDNSTLKWRRAADESPLDVRVPLRSWGGSIRANVFGLMIMRLDYTKPLDRPLKHAYWTVSLGPTF